MRLTTTIDVTLGRGQNMREHYRVRKASQHGLDTVW
jgi:hypothetical protein